MFRLVPHVASLGGEAGVRGVTAAAEHAMPDEVSPAPPPVVAAAASCSVAGSCRLLAPGLGIWIGGCPSTPRQWLQLATKHLISGNVPGNTLVSA